MLYQLSFIILIHSIPKLLNALLYLLVFLIKILLLPIYELLFVGLNKTFIHIA